jgi:hypothetical protein
MEELMLDVQQPPVQILELTFHIYQIPTTVQVPALECTGTCTRTTVVPVLCDHIMYCNIILSQI